VRESIFSLQDRIALITGAARGVGRAIALALADAGADVAVNDLQAGTELDAVVREVVQRGRQAQPVVANVAVPEDVERMVATVLAHFGRIDILVNNAGIMTEIPFLELTIEQWDQVVDVDLRGVFLCTHAVLPHMVERRRGVVINISSQLGQKGAPALAHYCAAKGGVLALTRALAREFGPYGIRVNAVAPGPLDTEMTRPYATPAWLANKMAQSVLARLGKPEEIAPTVVFLASDAAALYTGQTLYPNGGGVML
jgi:3-oxoacyl-[acyl-carrier protein] reductase